MDFLTFILLIIVILCFTALWIVNCYNKFQEYIIRSNEAEANIDTILRKRYDLLNKSINIIRANIEEEHVLENVENLRSKKVSNFDFDRDLYQSINEFNKYKEQNETLKQNEEFIKIDVALHESESEMTALRKYYNDTITNYNKKVKKFPSLLVALFFRLKKKPYYDGKNMDDKNTKDFKI